MDGQDEALGPLWNTSVVIGGMHPCMSRLARLQQMGARSSVGRSPTTRSERLRRLCDPGCAGRSSRTLCLKLRQVPRTRTTSRKGRGGNRQKARPTTFAPLCSCLYLILRFWGLWASAQRPLPASTEEPDRGCGETPSPAPAVDGGWRLSSSLGWRACLCLVWGK